MKIGAVYPIPQSAQAAVVLIAILASAALPLYLLVFRPTRGRRTWGFSEVAAIALLFILTLPLAAVTIGIGLPLTLLDLSIVTLIQNVMFVALPVYVVVARYGLPASALGLRADRWPTYGLLGLMAAAAAIPLAIKSEDLAVFLVGLVEGPAAAAARVAAEHMADPLQPIVQTLQGPLAIVWFLFLLAVVVPIGEEVFFRGFVYGALRNRWGVFAAILASSLFFAVVHLQVVHGLPIIMLGIIFAFLYQRTGSLIPGIIVHALNNILAVVSVWKGWGF